MIDTIERFSLFATAGISIIISLLDLFGLLEGIPFLVGRTSTMSLLVLGIVVSYLAFERRGKLDKIEHLVAEGFDKTIFSLGGSPVRQLKDSQEVYEYLAQRIKEAKSSVDDLTWGVIQSTVRTHFQDVAFQKYLKSIVATAARKDIKFREVMTFPTGGKLREERLKRAEDMVTKNFYGYQLRYYDIDHQTAPPLIQFIVIDCQEVITTFYRGTKLPIEGEIYLATRHPLTVRFFQDYYDTIWQGATVIKSAGVPANTEILQKIRQQTSVEK